MIPTHSVRLYILGEFEFIQISHLWSLGKRVLTSKPSLNRSVSKPAYVGFPLCMFQTTQVVFFLKAALGAKAYRRCWVGNALEIDFLGSGVLEVLYFLNSQEWGLGDWRSRPKTPFPHVLPDLTHLFGLSWCYGLSQRIALKGKQSTALPDKSSTPTQSVTLSHERQRIKQVKWSHHCWWGACSQVLWDLSPRASTWFFSV